MLFFSFFFQAHSEDVNCVSWHPKDTSLLASGSDDNTVRLWKYVDADG